MANERTPMRAPWGDIASRLTEISDTVLFDDLWRQPGLSPRDRSLITVASLVALYRSNELPFHLGKALEVAAQGMTRSASVSGARRWRSLVRSRCVTNGVRSLKGGLRAPLSWTRTPLRSECSFGGVPRGARSS